MTGQGNANEGPGQGHVEGEKGHGHEEGSARGQETVILAPDLTQQRDDADPGGIVPDMSVSDRCSAGISVMCSAAPRNAARRARISKKCTPREGGGVVEEAGEAGAEEAITTTTQTKTAATAAAGRAQGQAPPLRPQGQGHDQTQGHAPDLATRKPALQARPASPARSKTTSRTMSPRRKRTSRPNGGLMTSHLSEAW